MEHSEKTSFEGRTLRGGPISVERFTHLMGLENLPGIYVVSVAWVRTRIEITLVTRDRQKCILQLERPQPDRASFLVLNGVLIAYNGDFLPEEVGKRLREVASVRLSGKTLDDLLNEILSDPGMRDNTPQKARGRAAALLDTWGGEDAYAEFFAGAEMRRAQLDSIDPGRLFDFIQHSDNECGLVSPHGVAPAVSLVDYPWDNRVRHLDEPTTGPRRDGGAVEPGDEGLLSTNLTEQDVIAGNPEKVKEVLEYAVRRCGKEGKPLLFSNTCVPTVIGEDVESMVRQYAKKYDVPLLFLAMSPRSMHDVFRDLLVDLRLRFEAEAGRPDPRAINLIGFSDERGTRDVCELLERFGVRINCLLLPDIDLERFRRLPQACLNVYLPNAIWRHHYDHLQRDSRIQAITPPGPFGIEQTKAFVREVIEALSIECDFEGLWQDYMSKYEREWFEVTKRCHGKRLGVVIRGVDTRYLTDPSETWGVPLVRMIEEAGFGLEVLIKVDEREEARTRARVIAELFKDPSRHVIRGFNSFEMMRKRLRESTCCAFFSQHTFDWRLSEAGKARFSLQHFEMGVPGAIRTVRRLIGICETPFFALYGKYLQRTPEGLRKRMVEQ